LADPTPDQESLATAIGEVSDRLGVLVREEIELAKAEMTIKLRRAFVGVIVAITAGIFLVFAVVYALEGFAWFLWFEEPTGHGLNFYWGFFTLALILILFGVLAGALAYRVLSRNTNPVPTMAIDEARKIRETVESGAEGRR
jgi:hypothetical protein